jgi:hypothetical protein
MLPQSWGDLGGGVVFGIGRGLQWVHGLDPCTTPSFGCPPKFLVKIHHFTIFLRDFSFLFETFYTSNSCRSLCAHRSDFHFMKIWKQKK